MNNIVAAILLISITVAGATTLYHYRDALQTDNKPLSLERIGPYNATYDLVYVNSGCLSDVLAYNKTIGNFTRVQQACAGSLVLLPHASPNAP